MSWTPLGPCCVIEGRSPRAVAGACTSIAFDPNVAGTVYVGTADGGVWKTTNRGESWVPLLDDQATLTVGAVAVARRSGHIFVGTGDPNPRRQGLDRGPPVLEGRGVLISENAGETWTHREGWLTPGSPSFVNRVVRPNPPEPVETTNQFLGARSTAIVVYPAPVGQPETRVVLGCTRGLYETLDGGEKWTKLEHAVADTEPRRHRVTGLVLDGDDVANPVLYVAIERTGIFRRAHDGVLTPVAAPFAGEVDHIALALSPPIAGAPRILYAVVTSPLGMLVGVAMSETRGDTWTDIGGNLPSAMSDGGDNRDLDINLAICADPVEPRTIYVGSVNLYRRRQGSSSWERIGKTEDDRLHVGQHALVFDPLATTPTLWIANDGGVYVSTDRGETWTHRNRGLGNMQVHSVASYPSGSVAFAGTQHNAAQRLVGHPMWQRIGSPFVEPDGTSTSAFDVRIDWMRPAHWYMGFAMDSHGPRPGVYRHARFSEALAISTNGGLFFANQSPPGVGAYYRRFVIDPLRPSLDVAAIWYADGAPSFAALTDRSLQLLENPADGWKVQPAPLYDDQRLPGGPFISAIALAVRPAGATAPYTRLHLGLSVGNYMALDITGGSYQGPASMWETLSPHPISAAAATTGDGVVYAGDGAERVPEHADELRVLQVSRSDTGGDIGPGGVGAFVSDIGSLPSLPTHRTLLDAAVNTIALDPQRPDRVLVGCDAGLFRSEDKGKTWKLWMDGLPQAMITHIDVQPIAPAGQPRMVRISTYGRGVWERPIDDEDPIVPPFGGPPSGLYLRHHAGFTRRPEPPRPDEVPEHEEDFWRPNADIRVDPKKSSGNYTRPKSTQSYQPDGPIDSIGFELLNRNRKLRAGTDVRVYLQVHNRGPGVARDVQVMMLWSRLVSEKAQELPGSFWDQSKPAMPLENDRIVWKPIGDLIVVPEIRPADPRVVHWEWPVPRSMPPRIALLAVVHTDDDTPLRPADGAFDTEELARMDGRFALAKLDVRPVSSSGASVAETVLGAAAILFGVGVVVYAATEIADS